ncbi:alpha/beta hydrolase [Actinoallomurus vinaceus]|uniref:Alpha/beta hydrolase n=1 Tax=Actinoallomurus vinaceus TaxID=1080074 RepID=A0ABP8UH22_9ACTN
MGDLGGVRLFHTDHGSGSVVLLLVHGWGGDGREWSPHVEALAGRHRVIVPDLRGHGRSDVPADGNTPRAMARDLAALVARLATGPVVAVGHSMGGQVVNLLAVEHPEAVCSVIALDPAHGAAGDEVADIPRRLRAYQEKGAEAAAEFIAAAFSPDAPAGLRTAHVRTMLGAPGHVVAQAYAGMYTDPEAVGIRARSEAYLRLRACPSLTVWTSAEHAAWEAGLRLPGARVEHWPGVGHYLHEERVAETVGLIDQWCDR